MHDDDARNRAQPREGARDPARDGAVVGRLKEHLRAPAAARAEGRDCSDLFVPADVLRDVTGRIVECLALRRA